MITQKKYYGINKWKSNALIIFLTHLAFFLTAILRLFLFLFFFCLLFIHFIYLLYIGHIRQLINLLSLHAHMHTCSTYCCTNLYRSALSRVLSAFFFIPEGFVYIYAFSCLTSLMLLPNEICHMQFAHYPFSDN